MTDYASIIAAMGRDSEPEAATSLSDQPAVNTGSAAGQPAGTATSLPGNGADPSSSGQDNPYAAVISQVDAARAQAGQLVLYGAREADPDRAAAAARLQPLIGGASTVIEQGLSHYQAQTQALRNGSVLQGNPALADWFTQNPLAPRVASDDLQNLDAVSRWSRQWSQGWSDAVNSNALARLYAEGGSADPKQVAALEATMLASVNNPASSGVVHYLAAIAGGLADSIARATPYAAAGAATGAAVGSLTAGAPTLGVVAPVGTAAGALAGAGAGFETGMWMDGYRMNAGSVMHALDAVRDANGNPIDPNAKAAAGFVAGVVGGTLNLVGLGGAGRAIGSGLTSLLSDGLAQAVARPGVGAALARAAVNVGKGGLTGAGLGALTEGTNVIAEQAARVATNPDLPNILNDPEQRQSAVSDIAASAASMALQLGAIHGVGSLPPLVANSFRARRSADDLAALNGMMQTASDSTTQSRTPALFEQWVASQTQGGRGENLFIPGDAVQELYQRKGIAPGPDDGVFGQFLPDIREQLDQARLTGGDVVVPTSAFAAHMAGTDDAAALMPHIRVGEDGMSQADLEAYEAAHGDALAARGAEMAEEYGRQQQGRDAQQQVHDDVLSQARAAGFAPDTAEQYASLMAARYATRAERLGDDPLDLYRSEGLRIEGPDRGGGAPPSSPDNLDMLINAVRSDRPEETDAALFGPSLMEFLAKRGGVEDPGGDFAAMGAGEWHKGRVGMRRFIRAATADTGPSLPGMKDGGDHRYSPDAATLAAQEAGYLPRGERPDINALHDAVRQELSGKKVYSEYALGRAGEYRSAVWDLSDTLDALGIDRKTASNAEIRAALEVHAGQDEAREFGQPARAAVARVTGEEIAPREASVTDLRAAARKFYDAELKGTAVHSEALGRDVQFRGSRKAFSASANPDKLRLFAALREVIAHGTLEESSTPRDPAQEKSTKAYHFVTAPVELNGRMVRVGAMIREDSSGDLYYNHAPIKEGAPATGHEAGAEDQSAEGFRDTAGKAGPRSLDGEGQTLDQRVGAPTDNVNLDVQDFEQGHMARDPTVWREIAPGETLRPGARVRTNPETGRAEVAQPLDDVLRGSIRLGEGSAVVKLFAKRDLSTFLHESGHLFLSEMERDAARADAPEQIRGDMGAIRDWLDASEGEALTVAQHEQFARGFEAYLMEGRAPSEALRGAFRRFRAWLVGIYRSVTGLGVELSPQIRDVFDRMLASDDEIARARDQQRLGGLFQTAQEAGMTDAEFRAYSESVERARGRALDGLTAKVMGDVRRERVAWWKHQEEPIREDVRSEVDARPEMRALELLRTGRMAAADGEPGRRITLDRQAIIDLYGSPAALDMLPKRVPPVYGESGVHPDLLASMVGARSGDALLKGLLAHEALRRSLRAEGDKRSVRAYTIDRETHDRMVERHGEMLTDGSLEGEALDQVHSERQLEILAAELRALARRNNTPPRGGSPASPRLEVTPLQVARRWADRAIDAKTIKEGARPNVYARAEAKAGRAAERALLAGDHAEAFRQKQAQLLNHALYLSAKAAKTEVDAGVRRLERFSAKAEFPTITPDFVDRIHELLRRFSVPIQRNSAELDRALGGVSLQSWATERLAEGNEFFVAPDLYDPTYARHLDEMTIAQFRDLADTVKSLAHAGRDLQQVTVDGEKQERAAVVGQMVDAIGGLRERQAKDFVNQGGASGVRGAVERATAGVSGFHAMLLKPETILDTLDSRDPNGIFNRAVWRPIKAAQGTENDLLAEVTGQLKALHESLGKSYGRNFDNELPEQPGITDPRTGSPMALKRRGLIGIALNVGNESNLQRLVDGYGWTREAVQALLDRHMTDADWRFVRGSWDAFESLFPRIEAMQRRLTGVGLEKIEPREVETAFGKFTGGYYPVIYDPNLSTLGDRIKAAGDQRFEADYVRATTQKGHTVSRVQQVCEPLSLDPDAMAWKLRQAVHDLAYREAIISADRLLRHPDVIAGMDRTIGRDQRKQLDRWLQGVANDQNIDTRGLAAMDAFLHRLRTNAMVVGIGFRASTMLKHGSTALSNSIGELGPRWLLRGSREFFGSPDKMRRQYAFVTAHSAEMRNRMNEIDRDVRDALQDTMGKPGIVPAIARFSHYGVAILDMASALPTWLGAFRKAQADGMEDEDAVAYADKLVRNAHGANGAPDLAAIQRGSEAQKLMTMFYGFFNHVYNRQVVGAQSIASGVRNLRAGQITDARGDFAHGLATFFFYLAMPALIEATVAGGLPSQEDADGWMAWAVKAIGGELPAGIPVLRDIADAAIHGKAYSMSPTGEAFDAMVALGKDVGSAIGLRQAPVSDHWLQHAITVPGYVFGLPTGQAAKTAQFLADVARGEQDPQSMADWMRGITFGPAPKKAAQR